MGPGVQDYMDAVSTLTGPPNILLGNGFSIAYEGAFRYDSLWNEAQRQGLLSPELVATSNELRTTNFEDVLLFLNRVIATAQAYGADPSDMVFQRMRIDAEGVRKALINAISKIHLEPTTAFTPTHVRSAALFFQRFQHVFTTNYDLLLYWILLKAREELLTKGRDFKDGFAERSAYNELAFVPQVLQEASNGVHYLHGALHLFHDDVRTWKYKASVSKRGPGTMIWKQLRQTIIEAVEEGRLPLIVAEGESPTKLARIVANPYLAECYERFQRVPGDLVTLGFSFSEPDAHIASAIAGNGRITRVLVGAVPRRNGEPSEGLEKRLEALRAEREFAKFFEEQMPSLEVEVFDAYSAWPWDSPALRADHPYWAKKSLQEFPPATPRGAGP